MRVAAVHALGEVKTSSALAALQTLLRDKEKAVRGAASWVMMGRKRESGKFPTPADTEHIDKSRRWRRKFIHPRMLRGWWTSFSYCFERREGPAMYANISGVGTSPRWA